MLSISTRLAGLTAVIFFGISACSTSTSKLSDIGVGHTAEDVARYITDVIRQELDSGNIKGVSVALVDGSDIIWSEGFGVALTKGQAVLTPNTPLPIASVTKVFTAVAIQQLAEQGIVDLDAALSFYIPELETHHNSVLEPTVRDVLSHYSGIPTNYWAGYRYRSQDTPSLEEWSSRLESLPAEISPLRLTHEPGSVMVYSNLGYTLLGLIVQRASGMAYTDYVQHHILEKVGMEDSAFVLDSNMKRTLHEQYLVMEHIDHPVVRDLPAGGLMSSADDLGGFAIALLNQAAGTLSASAWKGMYSVQHDGVDAHGDIRMGLGVFLSPPGVPLNSISSRLPLSVSHGGDMGQYHSQITLLPEERLGVVVLAVSDKGRTSIDRIADAALSAAYKSRIGALPEGVGSPSFAADARPVKAEKLAGYYATEFGLIKIEENEGNLLAKVDRIGAVKFSLEPQEDGQSFSLKPKLLGFLPVPNFLLNLQAIKIVAKGGQEPPQLWLAMSGFRIMPLTQIKVTPIPDSWHRSVGEYKVSDPTGSIPHIEDFSLRHDQASGLVMLEMRARGKKTIELPLNILSNKLAVIAGSGRDLGATVQLLPNNKILYSGLIAEKAVPSSS